MQNLYLYLDGDLVVIEVNDLALRPINYHSHKQFYIQSKKSIGRRKKTLSK